MATSVVSVNDSSTGYAVPLGWIALIGGLAGIAGSVLIRLGVLPKSDDPVGVLGIALFVGGYIACFIIPPLHRRMSALEQRINSLEGKTTGESPVATKGTP